MIGLWRRLACFFTHGERYQEIADRKRFWRCSKCGLEWATDGEGW